MYYLFHVFGFLAAAAYMLIFTPKLGINRVRSFVLTALTYASAYALMMILYYFVIGRFGGQNIVRVFVFIPPIAALFGKAMGMDIRKVLDLVAPVPCIVHGVSHLGCVIKGCCFSWLEADWGIYNPKTRTVLFPVQVFEAITALLIAAALIWILAKRDYNMRGNAMPLMLIMFGLTRFGWEFMRDNNKLFLNISELALWAAGMAVVGIVWLSVDLILKRKSLAKGSMATE